jgi:hypothetical protein
MKKGNKGYWLGKERLDIIGENQMWKGGKCKRKDERNDSLYDRFIEEIIINVE